MAISIINLTPHHVTVGDKTLPPSGEVARVSMKETQAGEVAGLPVITQQPGEVTGLPEYREGRYYIVSAMVRTALPGRSDLLSPGRLIRDDAGIVRGCEALVANRAPTDTTRVKWENKLGARSRRAFLALVCPDGHLRDFTGEGIPGVVAVEGSSHRSNGKWSSTTYTLLLAPGVRAIPYHAGWESGLGGEGLARALSLPWPATPADFAAKLGVTPREVLRYFAAHSPRTIKEWTRAAEEKGRLGDAPPTAPEEPEGFGSMADALAKAGLL